MVHCATKKFICDHCSKAFCVRDGLKRHLRIHTGEIRIDHVVLKNLNDFSVLLLQAKNRLFVRAAKKVSISQEICEYTRRLARNT